MIGNISTSVGQAVRGIAVFSTPTKGSATTIGGIRITFTPAGALSIGILESTVISTSYAHTTCVGTFGGGTTADIDGGAQG